MVLLQYSSCNIQIIQKIGTFKTHNLTVHKNISQCKVFLCVKCFLNDIWLYIS